MSEKPVPTIPPGVLTEEQIARISGGECSLGDWISILGGLTQSYESLVGFTSYVIERVATSTQS